MGGLIITRVLACRKITATASMKPVKSDFESLHGFGMLFKIVTSTRRLSERPVSCDDQQSARIAIAYDLDPRHIPAALFDQGNRGLLGAKLRKPEIQMCVSRVVGCPSIKTRFKGYAFKSVTS